MFVSRTKSYGIVNWILVYLLKRLSDACITRLFETQLIRFVECLDAGGVCNAIFHDAGRATCRTLII